MYTIRQSRHFGVAQLLMAAFSFTVSFTAMPAQAAGPTPAQASLNALISAPGSPLPIGTKLQTVSIADSLATVDFSHELKDFHGGDTDEVNAVNGILKTLGQYPTISRVQILVAGQPVESLGGVLVISQPLSVIRPAGHAQVHKMYFHRRASIRP